MSDTQNTLLHHKTAFDDWRSLSIGIYMALAGYGVMVGLPVISTSWVNNLGFTEVQVGYVTSADLFGLAIGAVFAYFTVAKYDRRLLTFIAATGGWARCWIVHGYCCCHDWWTFTTRVRIRSRIVCFRILSSRGTEISALSLD